MARRPRGATGEKTYHVVNRAVRRATLFNSRGDYCAFETVLQQALHHRPLRLMAFCVMPNHWHLVVAPAGPTDLSSFMHWLTGTHARRWHAHHGTTGTGPVYQDRFKAVEIESERQFLWACRYVERNPLRAGLVSQAQDWRWSSLWRRQNSPDDSLLTEWPCAMPAEWLESVNRPATNQELKAMKRFRGKDRKRGRPRMFESSGF